MVQAVKVRNLPDTAELVIENPFDHPRYQALARELTALEDRLKQAVKREQIARARLRGQQSTRPNSERAADLVAGGVVGAATAPAELEAARAEQAILDQAIREHKEKMASVKGEIDFAICKKCASFEADGHRNIRAGVLLAHEGLRSNMVLRGRLIAAGVDISEAAMPTNFFPAFAAVGSPTHVGTSPLWFYLVWLEQKLGIT